MRKHCLQFVTWGGQFSSNLVTFFHYDIEQDRDILFFLMYRKINLGGVKMIKQKEN